MLQSNRLLPASLALFGTATIALCQSTWLVGGATGMPEIRDALQLASAGDIVLVAPGTYAHFTDDLGVIIQATSPGSVDIELDPGVIPASCTGFCPLFEHTRFQPPAGQESQCIGLRFNSTITWFGGLPIRHRVSASGRVTFDQCELFANGLPVLDCSGEVLLYRTNVYALGTSGAPGMRVLNGSVQFLSLIHI